MTRAGISVEEQRRTLRLLLSRRAFVAAGVTASLSALGLAACSSDPGTGSTGTPNPGGMPSGAKRVTGAASLPSGSGLDVTDLSVDIFTQTVPVSASGGFTVGISPSAPSLALLLDKGGDGVLMAMWDPSGSSFEISSRTTAVALLYYGMGGYLLPSTVMSSVLSLIDSDPSVSAVESAVAQSVASDPHAIANNAAPLGPAISAAVTAMLGSDLRTAAGVRPALSMDPVPTLMSISPVAEQNGVNVNQDVSTTSLLISNVKRRPLRAYVYEIGNGLVPAVPNATPPDVSPAKLLAGPIDIDSTESLGLINSLKDFVTGTAPWSPVNAAPILLTLDGAVDETVCEVVILASSFTRTEGFNPLVSPESYEPAVFRDQHFVNEVAKWRSDTLWLLGLSFIGDMCLPVMSFLMGMGAITASKATVAAVVLAGQQTYADTFERILTQLQFGSVGQLRAGLADVIADAIRSDISRQFWTSEVQGVVGQIEAKALAAQSAATIGTRLTRGAAFFAEVFPPLFAVGAALELADLAAVIVDVFNSSMAATWTATLIKQKLGLAPESPTVSPGDRVVFKVTNPANTAGGPFTYAWSETSPHSTLSAEGDIGNVGSSITTSQTTVDLITTTGDSNPINVLVIGYDNSSGQPIEIGRAGTTVSFLLPAEITPTGRIASLDDNVVFVVTVSGTLPPGVTYRWTLTGGAGNIGASNVVTTTVPNVTWYADNAGKTDTLHVDVLSGATLLAKADVSISVAGPPVIDFSVAGPVSGGPFNFDQSIANGHFTYTPDYVGQRAPSPDTGLDGIYMAYDLVGPADNKSPGVFIAILLPSGAIPTVGQVLTKWSDQGHANQFQFDISTNLANPADPDATIGAPPGTGTLTVTAIGQQNNGEWIMEYAFVVNASSGGTISGTGTGKWGASGVPVSS